MDVSRLLQVSREGQNKHYYVVHFMMQTIAHIICHLLALQFATWLFPCAFLLTLRNSPGKAAKPSMPVWVSLQVQLWVRWFDSLFFLLEKDSVDLPKSHNFKLSVWDASIFSSLQANSTQMTQMADLLEQLGAAKRGRGEAMRWTEESIVRIRSCISLCHFGPFGIKALSRMQGLNAWKTD